MSIKPEFFENEIEIPSDVSITKKREFNHYKGIVWIGSKRFYKNACIYRNKR